MNFDKLVEYFACEGTVLLLDSQSEDHNWSRKSYLAARPQAEIKAMGSHILLKQNERGKTFEGDPWEMLQTLREERQGWLLGYLGYDLKNHLENLTSKNWDGTEAPDMYFMEPGFLMEFNRISGDYRVLIGELPEDKNFSEQKASSSEFSLIHLSCRTSQEAYLEKIRKAQRRISEGDFYEINLSHQIKGTFRGSAWALYQRMAEVGPVPFGAYLEVDNVKICCQSPERFLRKEGEKVFSQPIKGTAKRSDCREQDDLLKKELLDSPKEKAENLMIVDLVRNDLSRIARHGSVKVTELFGIQSFGTVHQMVSTVEALTEERDPVSVIKACFPMGSMTGTPKISAMKAIEEYEDYKRGIYSGAIGYITPNGNFDFNVVIRTAIIKKDEIFYSVGGAVTSDSIPANEWQETLIKARALLDTVGTAKKIELS
ncbi:MAG: aminodeoxychorismate synthase component I [Balneolaceae bacterium]|jgi:para-aminobenzoate synthetase component 1